jgi:hypothetical protein
MSYDPVPIQVPAFMWVVVAFVIGMLLFVVAGAAWFLLRKRDRENDAKRGQGNLR